MPAVTDSRALAAAGVVLALVAGWLFTIIIDGYKEITGKQDRMVERVAVLEVQLSELRRMRECQ